MSILSKTATNKYLTFLLDQEFYALSINSVQEVLEYMPITKVPRSQDYMLGVINVRGNAIPVMDLRIKLGLGSAKQTVDTCFVIVELIIDGEQTTIGALVDRVEEVIELEKDDILPPPKMGTKIKYNFIKVLGKKDERFFFILEKAFNYWL